MPAPFIFTNFAGTLAATIDSMTPSGDVGLPWVLIPESAGMSVVYSTNGSIRLNPSGGSGLAGYIDTAVPPLADYDITFGVNPLTVSQQTQAGAIFRYVTGLGNGFYYLSYYSIYGAANVTLKRVNNTSGGGVTTNLAAAPMTYGAAASFTVEVRGPRIQVFVTGNQTPVIDYTDTSPLTAAGRIGVYMQNLDSSPVSSDTTGLHLAGPFRVSPPTPVLTPSVTTLVASTASQAVTLTGQYTNLAAGSISISANNTPTTSPTIVSQFESGSTATSDLIHITPGTGYTSYPSTLTLTDTTDGSIVATIQVTNPAYFAVAPSNAAVAVGVAQQFTANPSTGSPAVTWSATNGTGAGTITAGGVLTGTAPGTVMVTASAPGYASSTVTVNVTPAIAPTAPVITLTPTTGGNVIAITGASAQGTSPIAGYALYAGASPGGEGTAPVATLAPSTVPLQFPAQSAAAVGTLKYYTAKAYDSTGTPNYSAPSNEVVQRTSALIASGTTYQTASQAPYGPSSTGLAATLGYTVYDTAAPVAGVLVPHTAGATSEIPGTGVYAAPLALDVAWGSVQVLWDAPAGSGAYVDLIPPFMRLDPAQSTAGAPKGTVLGGIRNAEARAVGPVAVAPATIGAVTGPGTLTVKDASAANVTVQVYTIDRLEAPFVLTPTM